MRRLELDCGRLGIEDSAYLALWNRATQVGCGSVFWMPRRDQDSCMFFGVEIDGAITAAMALLHAVL